MFKSAFPGYAKSYPHKSAYRVIDPAIALSKVWENELQDSLPLYLHIPFGESRCGSCDQFTVAQPEQKLIQQYLQAVERQAQAIRSELPAARFTQLAIDGGTPTFLSVQDWQQIFQTLHGTLGIDTRSALFSCEASPGTVDVEKLELLREMGVDRLSLEVQSFRESETETMGRPQDPETAIKAIQAVQAAGFPILNINLTYGAKDQSTGDWLQSVDQATHFQPEEIHLYPFYDYHMGCADQASDKLTDRVQWDEQRLDAYRAAKDFLAASGYEQVSLRMFRKAQAGAGTAAGSQSSEGTGFSEQSDGLIGLGCGADSYTREFHYSYEQFSKSTSTVLDDYSQKTVEEFRHAHFGHSLELDDQKRRHVMKELLQVNGLDTLAYEVRYGSYVMDDLPQLLELVLAGYMHWDDTLLQLTPTGLEMSDAIGPWLCSEKVNQLMNASQCG